MTTQDETLYTAGELSSRLGVNAATIRRRMFALGLGVRFGGRAANRYSEADYQQLLESMRPARQHDDAEDVPA